MNETPKQDPQDPHELKIPKGISPVGPVQDMAEAYMKSIIALPEYLHAIMDELSGINDSLELLALYIEKKGLAEGTLTNEDLEREEKDGGIKEN